MAIADPAPVPNSAQYYSPSFVAMAVNPSGAALVAYQEDGYPSSVKLLVQEDRSGGGGTPSGSGSGGTPSSGGSGGTPGSGGSGDTPSGGGSGGSGTGSGGAGGKIVPIVPRNLIVPAAINPDKPFVDALCPPDVTDCTMRVSAYAAFGAVPTIASAGPRKKAKSVKPAVLLATGRAVILPGHRARIKLNLTAAGRRALSAGHKVRIQLRVALSYNHGKHASFVTRATFSARHRSKHRR